MRPSAFSVVDPILRGLLFVLWVVDRVVLVWVIVSILAMIASVTSFGRNNPGPYRALMRVNNFLFRLTAPLLRPFRRFLSQYDTGPLDLSPILLWVCIFILRILILNAYRLIL